MRVDIDSVRLAWKSPVGVRELGNGPLWHSAGVIIMTPGSGDGQRPCPLCLQLLKVETEGLWVSLSLTPRLSVRFVNTERSVQRPGCLSLSLSPMADLQLGQHELGALAPSETPCR